MTVIIKERDRIRPGSQNYMILQHLRLGNSITGVEALHLFKVRDLPKRVSELRASGADINGHWKMDTTGARYMKYYLVAQKRA